MKTVSSRRGLWAGLGVWHCAYRAGFGRVSVCGIALVASVACCACVASVACTACVETIVCMKCVSCCVAYVVHVAYVSHL